MPNILVTSFIDNTKHIFSGSIIMTWINAPSDGVNTIFSFILEYWTASVVSWSEFLATDTEVSGSIPGSTRFSE